MINLPNTSDNQKWSIRKTSASPVSSISPVDDWFLKALAPMLFVSSVHLIRRRLKMAMNMATTRRMTGRGDIRLYSPL